MQKTTSPSQGKTMITPPKKKRGGGQLVVLWILVVLMAGALAYLFWTNQQLKSPQAQVELAEQASQQTIKQVSEIYEVPEGEEPAVATIIDVEKLRSDNPEFFAKAVNGDHLLVYRELAIIYRQEDNKVIAVAPIVIDPANLNEDTVETESNDVSEQESSILNNDLDTENVANELDNTLNNDLENETGLENNAINEPLP